MLTLFGMKLTLGAKLSILIALGVSAIWLVLYSGGQTLNGDVQEYGGLLLYLLAFPLGWLSGLFSHSDHGNRIEVVLYLLLMIPNCFLIGYSIAGLITLFRRLNPPRKRFTIGFLSALLAFGVVNIISYYARTDFPGAADSIRRVGFPFLVLEEGGFAYRHHFSQAALWSNIAIAVFSGSLLGLLLQRFAR